MNKFAKKRAELLAKLDDVFLDKVEALQRKFHKTIKEYFEAELVIDGNSIKSISNNYLKINKLSLIERTFRKEQTFGLLTWMTNQFLNILRLNKNYFDADFFAPQNMHDRARSRLLAQIGVNVIKDKAVIINGGWLDTLSDFKDPYIRVREISINAVSQGMKFEDFKKQLRDGITEPSQRSIRHHFYTNAYDSFSQFDRVTQDDYATQLNLKAFRYSGGLIKTSRAFCKARNGQIWTIEEAQEWKKLNWQGKKEPYEPLRDLGGWNCRHTVNYLPNEIAIRERPELKDIIT